MATLQLFNVSAVLCGAGFLLLSLVIARRADRYIPKHLRSKWLVMEALILFFLVGYLLFLVVVVQDYYFPTELITSTVFLGGAMFVLLVINVTKITIKRAKEEELRVVAANTELNQAYDNTIEGWGLALELRDEETEGHTRRVTEMTVKLARHFGVPAAEIPHIRRGALLHDVGKIAVRDSILKNQGALTDEERMEMEKHPIYAYTMLANIEYLKPALAIPLCHHERWDGTGYPRGLKGEEIPLAARIFAVADVWDALISQRRYHPAWGLEKVCAHIKEGAGSHFDPQVIASFMEIVACDLDNNPV